MKEGEKAILLSFWLRRRERYNSPLIDSASFLATVWSALEIDRPGRPVFRGVLWKALLEGHGKKRSFPDLSKVSTRILSKRTRIFLIYSVSPIC